MEAIQMLGSMLLGLASLVPAATTHAAGLDVRGEVRSFGAALLPDGDVLCVWLDGRRVMRARYATSHGRWLAPAAMLEDMEGAGDVALLWHAQSQQHILLTEEAAVTPQNTTVHRIQVRKSGDGGASWSVPAPAYEPRNVRDTPRPRMVSAVTTENGALAICFVASASPGGLEYGLLHSADGDTWKVFHGTDGTRPYMPVLIPDAKRGLQVLRPTEKGTRWLRRHWIPERWTAPQRINLATASTAAPAPGTLAAVPTEHDDLLAVANDNLLADGELSVRMSFDDGRTWPVRRILAADAPAASPVILRGKEDTFHVIYRGADSRIMRAGVNDKWVWEPVRLRVEPPLATVVPPSNSRVHLNALRVPGDAPALPIADTPFVEHVRAPATDAEWERARPTAPAPKLPGVAAAVTTPMVRQGERIWVGTDDGLYHQTGAEQAFRRHASYGVNGPLANHITGLAVDSQATLWVATPAGLSQRARDGAWTLIRGKQGLPWENLTAIAVDDHDRIWLGSTRGLILYDPSADRRQWYYRITERYLPDDHVKALVLEDDGVLVRTARGPGRVREVLRTLHGKAEYLEDRINERHRHLGMPSPAHCTDDTMTAWTFGAQPSDGLWTGYHVAAMCMAYSTTGEDRYRQSAKIGMEALYRLQNITGITGLVARSMVKVGTPAWMSVKNQNNWHLTSDGEFMWRDDVSSDQMDGHYLAFFTYFEHIAQFDAPERSRLQKQLRQTTDYLLDNNYQIIDWDGKRTLWGWWNPERLNHEPEHYLESGLYSLMMLSFLRTAHYVTNDDKYMEHFRKLSEEHGYVGNLLLQKKVAPDMVNHSDDQLSAVAFYPFLQLEHTPYVRDALLRSVRRHALVELPERNSFMAFVYATIDPSDADVAGGVRTLREMPRDRRNWGPDNGPRADVVHAPASNRRGEITLTEVLPYDERHFERWNQDPYRAKDGGNGSSEGAGIHYLLPYWMGRYHGLIAAPAE